MLNEGLAVMAVGVGTVFSFLIILWAVVVLLGKVIAYLNMIFPEQVINAAPAVKNACIDDEIAAAVAAAILRM